MGTLLKAGAFARWRVPEGEQVCRGKWWIQFLTHWVGGAYESQVEMPCRWLDLGVWRQVLAWVLWVISLEVVKNGKCMGWPRGSVEWEILQRASREESLWPRKKDLTEWGWHLEPSWRWGWTWDTCGGRKAGLGQAWQPGCPAKTFRASQRILYRVVFLWGCWLLVLGADCGLMSCLWERASLSSPAPCSAVEGFVGGEGAVGKVRLLILLFILSLVFLPSEQGEPFLSREPLEDTLQMQEDAGHGEPSWREASRRDHGRSPGSPGLPTTRAWRTCDCEAGGGRLDASLPAQGEGRQSRPWPRGFPPALQAVPVQGGGGAPRGLQPALGALLPLAEAGDPPQRADPGAAGAGAVLDHLTAGGPGLGPGPPPRERRGGGGPGGGLAPRSPGHGAAGEAKSLFSKEQAWAVVGLLLGG